MSAMALVLVMSVVTVMLLRSSDPREKRAQLNSAIVAKGVFILLLLQIISAAEPQIAGGGSGRVIAARLVAQKGRVMS